MCQLDVKNAFLYNELQEEVFMIQPPWFINSPFPNHVFHLNKAFYGLKQSPKPWFQKLVLDLLQFSFQPSWANTSLVMYHIAMDTIMVMVYIDDILVNSSSSTLVVELISYLPNSFVICCFGEISYFLGIQVHRNGAGMYLNQSKGIKDLLLCTNLQDSKFAPTQGTSSCTLSQTHGVPLSNPYEYLSVVGALQYVTLIRPDISFVVNKACQFMALPIDVY